MAKQAYSATKETQDRVPPTFEVDDKTFFVKRSGTALKKIVTLVPDDETAEDPAVNIEQMYVGISYVLVDPEKDPEVSEQDDAGIWHPKPAWLEGMVDFEVAQDFMEVILPRRAEGNEGEAVATAPTSASPSTTATEKEH